MLSMIGRMADRLLARVAPTEVASTAYCDRCAGPWIRLCWYACDANFNCGYTCSPCGDSC